MMLRPYHIAVTTALILTTAHAQASYSLVDSFTPSNFFQEFAFIEKDPTTANADGSHGFVHYLDGASANQQGLAGFTQDSIYLGVDYNNTTTTGRGSIRMESKKTWTNGLFIANIAHMPVSSKNGCGLWPAYWTYSPGSWPANGEIDIIEGVNTAQGNSAVLHTAGTCAVTNTGARASTLFNGLNCQGDIGCRQDSQDKNTWGAGFNQGGGGIYAMEWTDQRISTWFFPRDEPLAKQLVADASMNYTTITDTSKWGEPLASFVGGGGLCSFGETIREQAIVFNINFCGDWAGKDWENNEVCSALGASCNAFVGANPSVFEEAYWLIRSVKVYQRSADHPRREGKRAVRFSA